MNKIEMGPDFASFSGFTHFLYYTFLMCQCCLFLLPDSLSLSILLCLFATAAACVTTAPLPSAQRKHKAQTHIDQSRAEEKKSERERERERGWEKEKKTRLIPNKEQAPVVHFKKPALRDQHSRPTHHYYTVTYSFIHSFPAALSR